jgi:hypothetical protein
VPVVLWDASALAKRFATEVGTQTVNAVFSSIPRNDMVISGAGCGGRSAGGCACILGVTVIEPAFRASDCNELGCAGTVARLTLDHLV